MRAQRQAIRAAGHHHVCMPVCMCVCACVLVHARYMVEESAGDNMVDPLNRSIYNG